MQIEWNDLYFNFYSKKFEEKIQELDPTYYVAYYINPGIT